MDMVQKNIQEEKYAVLGASLVLCGVFDQEELVKQFRIAEGILFDYKNAQSVAEIKAFVDQMKWLFQKFEKMTKDENPVVRKYLDGFDNYVCRMLNAQKYMENFSKYIEIAMRYDKFLSKKPTDMGEFIEISNSYNTKMLEEIRKIKELLDTLTKNKEQYFGVGVFMEWFDAYEKMISALNVMGASKKLGDEFSKFMRSSGTTNSVQPNPELEARLAKINEANEMMQRFEQDFFRDLNKEISYLNKEMVEELIAKYEKIKNNFQMPLTSSVSYGRAAEACAQIQKLMDKVGEISKSTYSPEKPVVFGF